MRNDKLVHVCDTENPQRACCWMARRAELEAMSTPEAVVKQKTAGDSIFEMEVHTGQEDEGNFSVIPEVLVEQRHIDAANRLKKIGWRMALNG